jgi:hypothetical protein
MMQSAGEFGKRFLSKLEIVDLTVSDDDDLVRINSGGDEQWRKQHDQEGQLQQNKQQRQPRRSLHLFLIRVDTSKMHTHPASQYNHRMIWSFGNIRCCLAFH